MFSRLEPEHEGERLLAVENGVARRDQRLETIARAHRGGRLVQRRAVQRRRCAAAGPEVDPSILGTLFERGLDPDKRAQFGAHYTDRDKIPAEFLTHVSPLGWEHINLTGEIPLARHGTDGQRETLA